MTRSKRTLASSCLPALLGAGLFTQACASSGQRGSAMVHAERGELIDGRGNQMHVQGVSFSNWSYPDADHDESDYQRAADMGFNTVRFYFSYQAFEDDSAPYQYDDAGFAWLDQNVAWAKAHGIQLVLNLATPQGGAQSGCTGNALWDVTDNQDRVVALWKAIAQRYAAESAVLAYDLIYKPSPSSSLDQWQALATRIASAIREVDSQHLLVVEQVVTINCSYDTQNLPDQSLFTLGDPNVLYGFEFADSWVYNFQLTSGSDLGDTGAYPDDSRIGKIDWNKMTDHSQVYSDAAALTPDDTSWTQKRFYYTAVNPSDQIAELVLRSDDNPGKVYFDDLKIEEFDENFQLVRTLFDDDLEDQTNWYLYQDPSVAQTGVEGTGADGHRGNGSITLSGTSGVAELSFSDLYAFPVTLNHTYRVNGWMKGENIAPNGSSMFGLALWTYDGDVPRRNKANLGANLQPFVDWGTKNAVPLFVSEFTTGAPSFENGKGGVTWVSDMLDLMSQNGLHFNYREYHGQDLGIYRGDDGLPDPSNANQPLIDRFTQKLHH